MKKAPNKLAKLKIYFRGRIRTIKLRVGERRRYFWGRRGSEGWYSEAFELTHKGDHIHRTSLIRGADCDGPYSESFSCRASIHELRVYGRKNDSKRGYWPHWVSEEDYEMTDTFAQQMNY